MMRRKQRSNVQRLFRVSLVSCSGLARIVNPACLVTLVTKHITGDMENKTRAWEIKAAHGCSRSHVEGSKTASVCVQVRDNNTVGSGVGDLVGYK